MRTTNERIEELHRRVEKNKIKQRSRITMLCSFAVCLMLIIGASLIMPQAVRQTADKTYSNSSSAASIFTSSNTIGFIIIGILSFALGVCVTIICYKLHRASICDKEHDND